MATQNAQHRESLIHGHSGRMFVTFTMITLFGSLGRLVLSPLLPTIITDLNITRAAAGVGLTVMWAFTAAAQFPGGRLSDRLSRKTMLVAGLGGNVLGFTMLALSDGYAGFIISLAFVGVGTGLFIPAKYLVLSELFDERRGQAFGINSAAAEMGGVLSAVAALVVLSIGAWRLTFFPIAAVLAIGILGFHSWSSEEYRLERVDMDIRGTARRLIGNRHLLLLLVIFSLYSFVWQGITGFLPDFLYVQKAFSESLAGNAFGGMFVVAAIVTPLAGIMGDRIGHARVGTLTPLIAAIGLGVILHFDGVVPVLLGIAIMAGGIGSFWPLLYVHLMEALPDEDMGGDFGATRTVFMGLGSIGPAYVGIVVDLADYGVAFSGFVVCLLLTTLLLVLVVRSS
ncbi:MFS transporter [Natrialbaceae archaeon A-chndr2]